jgi:hypothetical protein
VLNDLFREAERLGVIVYGVRVTASGGFNTETCRKPLGPGSRELCWRWWLQSSVRSVIERFLGDGYARNPPAAADLNSAAALGGRGEVRLRPVSCRAGR